MSCSVCGASGLRSCGATKLSTRDSTSAAPSTSDAAVLGAGITATDFSKGNISMVQSTAGRVLNGADLERQIEADVRNRASMREARHANAAPAPRLSMPEYVQHCEGATEIGKLSAEAV